MSSLRTNIMLNPKPRIYEHNLFVNREHEINLVEDRIRRVQADQTVPEAVINFWGIRGIGKTWILKQLKNKFSYDASIEDKYPTFVLFVEFSKTQNKSLLDKLAKEFAKQIVNQLSTSLPHSIKPQIQNVMASGNIEELADVILELAKLFTPLVLLDDSEIVQPEVWEEIERQFFEPIISTGRTIIVVSGRRQVPRWRRFEVRRRVMETNESQVRPFGKKDVLNQISNRKISIPAGSLFPYTAGDPHLVDTLLLNIQAWKAAEKKRKIDDGWLDAHQTSILKILQAAEHELLKKIENRLKQPLIAVASLRFYRLEAMKFMLAKGNKKDNKDNKDQPDGYYLSIVRDLDQETDVVWWDRERRAYVTSEVVRKLINRRQLLENKDKFISSHKCALEMYRSWANEFPRTSEEFLIEMLFHYASIFEVTGDTSNLHSNFIDTLQLASKLITDRMVILQKQIDGDRELIDLLPEKLYEELRQQVEFLLKKSSNTRTE